MLWVVQKNLFIDNKRGELLHALKRMGIPFCEVLVSSYKIFPEIEDESQAIITNGSVILSRIAQHRIWRPGSFFNDIFDFKVWSQHYHDFLLNKDALVTTLGQAQELTHNMFVRPLSDQKTFNGKVFTPSEFSALQEQGRQKVAQAPSLDTPVLLAPVKTIGQEHRHFIVDGKVVTSSRYKLSGQPNFSRGCDKAVLDVVETALEMWQPSDAFVMDTYISGDDIGIVEMGGICHAGLYEADLFKLVDALEEFGGKYKPESGAAKPKNGV